MGRNLYIFAGTLGLLAIIAGFLSFTGIAQGPGSPGDARLWRTTGLALLCVALVVALGGVMSSLFEQAERRASDERADKRRRRSS